MALSMMVDVETMSADPSAAIASIGWCFFDDESVSPPVTQHVDLDSCIRAGLTVEGTTMSWWMRQSEQARTAFVNGQLKALSLEEALNRLERDFLSTCTSQGKVWSHGANFDVPILEHAFFRAYRRKPVWKFWNVRCTRTLFDLAGGKIETFGGPRTGVYHEAGDDAAYQARAVQNALRALRGPRVVDDVPDLYRAVLAEK